VEFTVWLPWRTAAARCLRGEKTGRLYSRAQGGEGGLLAYQGNQVMAWDAAWPDYGGMGGDARRPIANQGRCGARTAETPLGGRCDGREHVAHRERVGKAIRRGGPTAHGPTGSRLPRRSDPRGVAVSARDATRRRAVRRSGSKPFQVPYFE
jgi:hypothetical protein